MKNDLNEKIEKPFNKILDRLIEKPYDTFAISREELETIKKYLLIQQYRNYKNSLGYQGTYDEEKVLSRYNIKDGETQRDYWKREMQTILDNSFDDLLYKLDLVGVKQKSMRIFNGFLMFVHACEEFVINDLGYVTERIPVELKIAPDEYANINEELGKKLFGAEGFGKTARERAEQNAEYIDNYKFF